MRYVALLMALICSASAWAQAEETPDIEQSAAEWGARVAHITTQLLGEDTALSGDFAPTEDVELGGDFAPAEDDVEMGGDFAPVEDEAEWGGDFAPVDEVETGGDFAPVEDAEIGGDFAPADDAELGGAFAPAEDAEMGGDFAPADDVVTEALPEMSEAEEDAYYDQFWEELEAEQEVAAAPPETLEATVGRLSGTITDYEFGEPVFDALITLSSAGSESPVLKETSVRTGVEGTFYFDAPPGLYRVSMAHTEYQREAYEIELVEGETLDLGEVVLSVAEGTSTTIVVEAEATRGTEATELLKRRESASVQDGLSAQEISRSGDSSTSSAVKRVVGSSIVDGQFLFVRGLGGRYVQVLLNGVAIPSTDPDFPGVQLDILPTTLLSGLTLVKTAQAPLPGAFAGGQLHLSTQAFPETFTASVSAGMGVDTLTHSNTQLGYAGGSVDALGFDDGSRALPDSVPEGERVSGRLGSELETIGESFANRWNVGRENPWPSGKLAASIGDTLDVDGTSLAYLFSAGFRSTTRTSQGTLRNVKLENDALVVREDLERESGSVRADLNLLASTRIEPNADNEINLIAFYNHTGDQQTRRVNGYSDAEGANIEATQLRWLERGLLFSQIFGQHRHLGLDSTLSWDLSFSYAHRSEPDTRDLTYLAASQGMQWRAAPGSGERFFAGLEQLDFGAGSTWEAPLTDWLKLTTGGRFQISDRRFDARRFRYDYIGSSSSGRYLQPEQLFGPESVGDQTEIVEVTLPTDSYRAQALSGAIFGQTGFKITPRLQANVGVRYEAFDQSIEAVSPWSSGDGESHGRTDHDALPSASVAWELYPDMFVRAAYGGTVARPQTRELAPFLFQDYVRRRTVQGNPDLDRTFIHNADVRWEWYPSETEVIATSFFFKHFQSPIEPVILDRNGNVTSMNVDAATNLGGELELRSSLRHLADALSAITVGANLALIHSEVQLSDEQLQSATNAERPLAGQSPFVANVFLGLDLPHPDLALYAFYNISGRRIEEVGLLGLPDVYLEPVHQVDLTFRWQMADHWSLSASARNLAFQPEILRQGDIDVVERQRGASFSLGLQWQE